MCDHKKIAVLVGSYVPYSSAVGNCAEKIVKELAKINDVTVICLKTNECQSDYEELDNYRIFRISYRYAMLMNSSTNNFKKTIYRIFHNTRIVLSRYDMSVSLVNLYLDKLNENCVNYHAIIPFSFPVETLQAACLYKEKIKKTKVIPLVYDNYVNSASLHKNRLNAFLKRNFYFRKERFFIENSDRYIVIHTLFEQLKSIAHPRDAFKLVSSEHPLLIQNDEDKSESTLVRVTYAGALISGYVEASDLLRVILKVNSKFIFDFYAFGSAITPVVKAAEANGNINYYGKVSNVFVKEAIAKSDVLINISEKSGKQMSSKLFEYMSAGKPIIQYSFVKECINKKILARYPLVLFIDHEFEFETKVKMLSDFLSSRSKMRIGFNEVSNLYPDALPSYCANIVESLIAE